MSVEFEHCISRDDEEICLIVEYDYTPRERMTECYPGCNEDVEICWVRRKDTKQVFILTNEEKIEIEQVCFDDAHRRIEENKLERQLERSERRDEFWL